MNREKDTDARLWRRCIDDRRRGIISFPVAIIRPIIPPVMLIAVVVMPTSSVLITVVVMPTSSVLITAMSSLAVMVISEDWHHVYTADHCG
jgi:hypothetical protein